MRAFSESLAAVESLCRGRVGVTILEEPGDAVSIREDDSLFVRKIKFKSQLVLIA